MKRRNKRLVIAGLIALCVILTVGVFMLGQSPKTEDTLQNIENVAVYVTPGDISEAPPDKATPDIKPSEIPKTELPVDGITGNDIPLTVIENKTESPELPDTAHRDDADSDEHQELPTNPALTNPDKKPDSTPKPVEPTKPKESTPNSGDKNGKGEIYIPGFGWIKDEGGGTQAEKSVGEGSLDKIIGH